MCALLCFLPGGADITIIHPSWAASTYMKRTRKKPKWQNHNKQTKRLTKCSFGVGDVVSDFSTIFFLFVSNT